MKIVNWQPLKSTIGTMLLLAIALACLPTQKAQAQFTSPPGQGVPKGTAGGGSRPTQPFCLQQPARQKTLLAMAPTQFVGLTPHQNPAIWIYVPNTTAQTLEFSLFTQEQEGVYQTKLPIRAPGLLKITVPNGSMLKTGKPYYWTAALICNPNQRTNDWLVGGWIQQQPFSSALQRQLLGATLEQQVKLYTQTNFWYEAFNAYLSLQQAQPNHPNLSLLWASLLKTAGLSTVSLQSPLPYIAKPPSPTQAHH